MKTWECPFCHVRVKCLGVVEGHKCPSRQHRWVPGKNWLEVKDAT